MKLKHFGISTYNRLTPKGNKSSISMDNFTEQNLEIVVRNQKENKFKLYKVKLINNNTNLLLLKVTLTQPLKLSQ